MTNPSNQAGSSVEMMLDDPFTLNSLGATLSGLFLLGLVLYAVIAATCWNG